MTAAQALSHPWIQNHNDIKVPLDILIFRADPCLVFKVHAHA